MTTADVTPPFNPKRPFRTRDGRVIHDFHVTYHGEVQATRAVPGTHISTSWDCDGTNQYGMAHLDLVNLPEAPPTSVENEGQTDAALIEQMLKAICADIICMSRQGFWRGTDPDDEQATQAAFDKISAFVRSQLARRAALGPNAAAVPQAWPVTKSGQCVRDLEHRGWFGMLQEEDGSWSEHIWRADGSAYPDHCRDLIRTPSPPTAPAPASPCAEAFAVFEALKLAMACEVGDEHIWMPDARAAVTAFAVRLTQADAPAGGDVGEAEVEAFMWAAAGLEPGWVQRGLQAAARVRAASPDGEGWRPIETAPKNGNPFWIMVTRGAPYAPDVVMMWSGRWCRAGKGDTRLSYEPTYWRPLPPPPSAQPDPTPTPVPSTDATGGTTMDAFSLLKIVDDWATRWIHDRSHQASGSPDFVHGYQRGASHVAIELRKLVIGHMPDFHNRVVAEQSRAALRSDQGGR